MKALCYIGGISLECLQAIELPDPTPSSNEIVVRMRAASLNRRDLAIAVGDYHAQVSAPLIPISDGAGEVVALGEAVTRFRLGDVVCPVYLPNWIGGNVNARASARRLGGPTNGVLRELFCSSEEDFVKAPRHLSFEEAATLPLSAVTAWHSLFFNGNVMPGETVLVQGTGGVSTAAVQLAGAAGAKVISVIRNVQHVRKMSELGASEIIVSDETTAWTREVIEKTNGVGAHVILNVAGGQTVSQCLAAAAGNARVHLIGYAADKLVSFDMFDAIRRAVSFRVGTAGSRESFEHLVRILEQNKIRPPVAARFSVCSLRDGIEQLATGGHFGKIILTFDM